MDDEPETSFEELLVDFAWFVLTFRPAFVLLMCRAVRVSKAKFILFFEELTPTDHKRVSSYPYRFTARSKRVPRLGQITWQIVLTKK